MHQAALLTLLTSAGAVVTLTGDFLVFSRIKFGADRQIDPMLIAWPFAALSLGDVGAGVLLCVVKALLWMPISVFAAGFMGAQVALLRRRSQSD